MKYFLVIAAALAVLAAPVEAGRIEQWDVEVLTPAQVRAKYRSWDLVCSELRDVDCSGIRPPLVKTFPQNPLRPGLLGYYDGSDIIYIRRDLYGLRREEVLTHEMSHYIDKQLGITPVPGPAKDICWSEKRAWEVSDNFWKYFSRPDKVVGSKWADWYLHCTPFKGDMYPEG